MAEELQGLLERIHEEGIKKADSEKDTILTAAKAEAEEILNSAKAEAEQIRGSAKNDAKSSEERAKSAIQQASRDILLALRNDLETRLKTVVKDSIGDAMTTEVMGGILIEMVKSYRENNPSNDPSIEVIIAKSDYESMEKLFKGSLLKDLKDNPDLSIGHDFSGGLKIGFKGDDVFFDFSDDAISDLICSLIGPKLSGILKG